MEQNTTPAHISQMLLGANDKGRVTYEVNGETINLSFKIVRDYLTRGNAAVTDAEVIQFISICKANKLNPFIGEAWLVKFQGSPASMITARDAFLKRAESSPNFTGFQSGVILIRNNELLYEEGAFYLQSDQLVGGWCKVYRKDREFPYVAKVRIQEYNKGKSTWSAIPGTMIQKVAEAQALRKAFPFQTSGLYTPEEMPEEQPAQASATEEANKALPAFQPAPALQPGDKVKLPDGEVKEVIGSTDPKPDVVPDPEPVPIVVKKDETDPKGERLPWEGDASSAQASEDNNLDLFKL